MRLEPGTRVQHDLFGRGTVLRPTGHTHENYELVEMDAGDGRTRLRLRRDRLAIIRGNTEPEETTSGHDGGAGADRRGDA